MENAAKCRPSGDEVATKCDQSAREARERLFLASKGSKIAANLTQIPKHSRLTQNNQKLLPGKCHLLPTSLRGVATIQHSHSSLHYLQRKSTGPPSARLVKCIQSYVPTPNGPFTSPTAGHSTKSNPTHHPEPSHQEVIVNSIARGTLPIQQNPHQECRWDHPRAPANGAGGDVPPGLATADNCTLGPFRVTRPVSGNAIS